MAKMNSKAKIIWDSFFGSAQQKYESRYWIMSGFSRKFGFGMYHKNRAWLTDPEFMEAWKAFPAANDYRHERKFNFYYMAKSLRDVPGDLAECGVYHAGSSHLMLWATRGTKKHLHGFDSFEGLSAPETEDTVTDKKAFVWKQHDLAVPETLARNNLAPHEGRFTLHKGWIPTRFNDVADKTFCLVHIDVDLYAPTSDTLNFFFPRLSLGGMIVCDDYGSTACPGAFKAMNDFATENGMSVIHLTTGQGVLVKHRVANVT